MELPFREVYKCSWLKLSQTEKKCNNVPKQWVIFCVHNDSIPFLEIYTDEKVALTHKPTHSYQLSSVLHITPSICPHDDDDYEFVITFPNEMVRFTASSQHQMMSWVKRLNAKLREMKLLAPNENLYTCHLPENRSHLLPTRDPNSPLPLPPAMTYIPPGVEPVSSSSGENSEHHNHTSADLTPENSVPDEVSTCSFSTPSADTRAVHVIQSREGIQDVAETIQDSISSSNSDLVSSSQNRLNEVSNPSDCTSSTTSNNVTVIEVSSSPVNTVFTFTDVGSELNNVEQVSTVSVMPIDSNFENVSIVRRTATTFDPKEHTAVAVAAVAVTATGGQTNGSKHDNEARTEPSERSTENRIDSSLVSNTNLYEHVFLPPAPPMVGTSQQSCTPCTGTPLSPVAVDSKLHSPLTSVNMQSSAQSQLPKMGRGRGNVRGRRRSNSNSESSSSHQMAADRIRGAGPNMNSAQRLQPAPHPFIRQVNSEETTNPRLTLREQQVMQLRREMSHPGGVRLQLRRKDCLNSIALIDAFQSVWIAGWKQKEHPMLYTALHIGDQLISLGGKMVNNAADAQKLIRAWPSLYIEFVIRRVPCGRVYALRKEQEGQNLGIVQENNTAEIKEVVAKSVVAAHGLTTRVRTMNGLSWTNWYITEVNGRPLNLFFKDNEVRDRLNAVGLDISLLVQPSDLIKQIKKQLKVVKNYKDYIVQ